MENEIVISEERFFTEIATLIEQRKNNVRRTLNNEMVMLYWEIGKYLSCNILQNKKAGYGEKTVESLSKKLTLSYGKGFEKSALFRMIKFYEEFGDIEKVATLSQQLTWSHFVELLPIEDSSKRDFLL